MLGSKKSRINRRKKPFFNAFMNAPSIEFAIGNWSPELSNEELRRQQEPSPY